MQGDEVKPNATLRDIMRGMSVLPTATQPLARFTHVLSAGSLRPSVRLYIYILYYLRMSYTSSRIF